jgi:small subunit ribosomal protein S15
VLGHRPGDEAKWLNCDLAKILVMEEDILAAPALPENPAGTEDVKLPHFMNYGVKEQDKEKLFETLPVLTAEAKVRQVLSAAGPLLPHEQIPIAEAAQQEGEETQYYKAGLLARIVDLRNANARGVAYENRQRCIAAFSAPGKPNDTGRPEVQGMSQPPPIPAISSYAICLQLRS